MCGFCHSTFVIVPVIFTGLLSSNSAANEWCAPSWTPASSARIPTTNPKLFRRVCVAILPFLAVVFSATVLPVPPRDPGSILRVLSADPRRLRDLLADEGDLVIAQPPLVQPVEAGDLFERVDGGLNPLSLGHGDELDVAVHVAEARIPRRNGTAGRYSGLGTRHARYFPSTEYRVQV